MADATGGDRRRWMLGAAGAVVVVGVLAFLLGSGGSTIPSVATAPAVPPATSPTTPPALAAPSAPVLASEADLLGTSVPDDAVALALEDYLIATFSGPSTSVDRVTVRPGGDGTYAATVSLAESTDGGPRRLAPIGLTLRASGQPAGVVIESMAPATAGAVLTPGTAGEVAEVADPVRDALGAMLAPWPGAVVEAVGNDAGRWWARVALPLPSGGRLAVLVWPDLAVGLGTGG